MACLAVATKQEPQVIAGLPYVANYASSYNAHVVNHDIRVGVAPVVNAPVAARVVQPAPIIKSAPIQVAQAVSAYSPVIASYSLPAVPLTNPPAIPLAATPVNPQSPPVIPGASRSSRLQSEDDSKPSRSTQSSESQQVDNVPSAVLLASQFLVRHNQNRAISPNPEENEQNQQPARFFNPALGNAQNQPLREQENPRSLPVLGATPNGFGFVQRQNARFAAQVPQDNQRSADLRVRQLDGDQQKVRSGKLIRENQDSELVEVNNPNLQNYESGKVPVAAPVAPARLAFAPSVNLLPSLYSSVIQF